MKYAIVFFFLLAVNAEVMAQFPNRTPTPNDTLKSVQIWPDNRAILSIYAPKASEVTVSGDFPGGFPSAKLAKAENGVWSVTLNSLTPDVYTYDFTVDGVKTFDPKNGQGGHTFLVWRKNLVYIAPLLFR